ncbi:hypothetical protein BJ742DRAFT_793556 [Cladochytrium replicatum]|nr:hypothetical protein BJ742DRAFT_793556 [Cladochytrium replicatum]
MDNAKLGNEARVTAAAASLTNDQVYGPGGFLGPPPTDQLLYIIVPFSIIGLTLLVFAIFICTAHRDAVKSRLDWMRTLEIARVDGNLTPSFYGESKRKTSLPGPPLRDNTGYLKVPERRQLVEVIPPMMTNVILHEMNRQNNKMGGYYGDGEVSEFVRKVTLNRKAEGSAQEITSFDDGPLPAPLPRNNSRQVRLVRSDAPNSARLNEEYLNSPVGGRRAARNNGNLRPPSDGLLPWQRRVSRNSMVIAEMHDTGVYVPGYDLSDLPPVPEVPSGYNQPSIPLRKTSLSRPSKALQSPSAKDPAGSSSSVYRPAVFAPNIRVDTSAVPTFGRSPMTAPVDSDPHMDIGIPLDYGPRSAFPTGSQIRSPPINQPSQYPPLDESRLNSLRNARPGNERGRTEQRTPINESPPTILPRSQSLSRRATPGIETTSATTTPLEDERTIQWRGPSSPSSEWERRQSPGRRPTHERNRSDDGEPILERSDSLSRREQVPTTERRPTAERTAVLPRRPSDPGRRPTIERMDRWPAVDRSDSISRREQDSAVELRPVVERMDSLSRRRTDERRRMGTLERRPYNGPVSPRSPNNEYPVSPLDRMPMIENSENLPRRPTNQRTVTLQRRPTAESRDAQSPRSADPGTWRGGLGDNDRVEDIRGPRSADWRGNGQSGMY